MEPGEGSTHNVNTIVQPTIPVQATRRLRLTAQPITTGDNMSPSDFRFLKRGLEGAIANRPKRDLGEQDGFHMWTIKGAHDGTYFWLEHESEIVAILEVGFHGHVGASYVEPEYRGRKFSTALYSGAILVLGELKSDDSLGTGALRTWKSLTKYHTVHLMNTDTDEEVEYTWGPDAMPLINGKTPMNRDKQSYYFMVKR